MSLSFTVSHCLYLIIEQLHTKVSSLNEISAWNFKVTEYYEEISACNDKIPSCNEEVSACNFEISACNDNVSYDVKVSPYNV